MSTTTYRKFQNDRSVESDTPFYGLYVKLTGEARRDFVEAKNRMTQSLGGVPSNPMVIDELLRTYLNNSEGMTP